MYSALIERVWPYSAVWRKLVSVCLYVESVR